MEPTQSLDLRWNSFETNTRVTLKKLRGESEFSDVTLACGGGRQVSAHKVILAGGSSFFQQILRQNPHPHPLVYLKGVRYEDLLKILDFVYTGEATVAKEELNSFLEVAEDLQIKGLMEKDASSKTSPNLPNTSYQDSRVVKENVSLPQRNASSRINNKASQSPYQEEQDDTPLSNIKIDLTDTAHSDDSFGMDNGEEIMDSEKKEMTNYRHDQSEELGKEGQTAESDSLIQHSNFSDPHNINTSVKMEKDLNFEVDSHIERDELTTEFSDGYYMTESELVGSVSNDDEEAHYWYEEDGEYTSAKELAGTASIDEEVAKATSMKHNVEQGQKPKVKGMKVCTVCGKSMYYSYLKVHMVTHTGEKPFQCSVCNKRFSRDYYMKIHEKKCTMKL